MGVGGIFVTLRAITSKFQGDMDKARAAVNRFRTSTVNINRQLKRVGKQMSKVGKQMSTSFTLPIVAAGGLAIKVFADFEQSMAKVQAVSGATGDEFKKLEKLAKDLGATTRFTAAQVAELELNYSKLGFVPAEIEKITKPTLDLALATGEDLANSAEVAGATLRGLGLTAADMPRVVDVMAKSFSTSALDLESFREAMKLVAPTAVATGRDMETVTAQLGILANNGIKGSIAGTQLNRVFIELNKKGLTLKEALDKVSSSSNGLATATDLVKDRGAKALLILAKQRSELVPFERNLRNASGAAREMAIIMDDTLQGSLLKVQSALEGAAIELGNALAPTIKKVGELIADLANRFSNLAPQTKKAIVVIAGLVAAAGPLIFILGTIATAAAAITGPMILAAAAITALVVGIVKAVTSGDELTTQFERQKTKVEELESSLNPLIARHDELKEKSNLTTKEQKELDQIIQDIATHVPGAITQFDKFGKAMSVSTTAARDLIIEQKNLLALDNAEAIKEQQNELIKLNNRLTRLNQTYIVQNGVLMVWDNVQKRNIEASRDEIKLFGEKGKAIKSEIQTRVAKLAQLRGEISLTEKLADVQGTIDDKKDDTTQVDQINKLNTALTITGALMAKQAERTGELIPKKGLDDAVTGMTKLKELAPVMGQAIADSTTKATESVKEMSVALAGFLDFMDTVAVDVLSGFGEALGAAFGGGGDPMAGFKAFAKDMMNVIKSLGVTMIAVGTGLSASVFGLVQGPATIAAGIALVAAATAGAALFADGGLVFGETLGILGEGRGTSRSNPEVIAPLDKLQGMMPSGGGMMAGNVTFEIAGTTLRGVLRNTNIRAGMTSSGTNFKT